MLTSLPPELLLQISSYLPVGSLFSLSATCSTLHGVVHKAWTLWLSGQASEYPALRSSLTNLNWTKNHNEWTCDCGSLVAGPWIKWPKLARYEATIEGDSNVSVGAGCAAVSDLIFCCPKARSVQWRKRNGLAEASGGVLIEYNDLPEFTRYPLYVTLHHNTLVLKRLRPQQGYRRGDYTIDIYNAKTLKKVGLLNPVKHIKDVKSLSEMEISSLSMSYNCICVHIMFDVNQENEFDGDADIENIRENETQLWYINTAEPQIENLHLLRIIKHPLAFNSLLDPGLVSVNNKFVTRVGTPTAFNLNQIQWFSRNPKVSESNLCHGYMPVKISSSYDYSKASVRIASLGGGNSEYIAVGLELGIDHRDRDHSYLIVVQVYHVTSGVIIVEKDFGTTNHIDEKIKMSWFGPHLAILSRSKSTSNLHSWQLGLDHFILTPCKIQVGSVHWAIDWFWIDFEGIVAANVNFGLEETVIQSYQPIQKLRKSLTNYQKQMS